jgi:hypothetical protein
MITHFKYPFTVNCSLKACKFILYIIGPIKCKNKPLWAAFCVKFCTIPVFVYSNQVFGFVKIKGLKAGVFVSC